MFGTKKNKEEHRYYLLPGMGKSNRRHHQRVLFWSVIVGSIFAALFGSLLYWLNRH